MLKEINRKIKERKKLVGQWPRRAREPNKFSKCYLLITQTIKDLKITYVEVLNPVVIALG